MTPTEEQNLAMAGIFIEQFLGKGDMTVAADVLDVFATHTRDF